MYKTPQLRSIFRRWAVEKVHAVVARSTFPSQNVQSTPFSDHFWKLRCRKSARRCGAKHISKSKVSKTDGFGTLLDGQMSFCVAGAEDCAPCQKWAKREGFVAVSTTTTICYTTPHYTTENYATLYYTTLHYTPLHYITFHHTTFHFTTLHYTSLQYTTLSYTTLHYANYN